MTSESGCVSRSLPAVDPTIDRCVLCRHVNRYAGPHKALVNAHCLYRFDEPVSPHLAAGMAVEKAGARVSTSSRSIRTALRSFVRFSHQSVVVPTDDAFITSVSSYIRKCAAGTTEKSHMYIETAGGES